MIASILILVFALVLLIYWFRYTCILILKDRPELSDAVAPANVSGYKIVQRDLVTEPRLEELELALKRDFELLNYILEHASGMELSSLEHRLLLLDYKLMKWQFRLTKSLFPGCARRALGEMASVTDVLARRVASGSSAKSQAASS
jgi:hypothetical protein